MAYNWPRVQENGPPLREQDIVAFEQRIGHSLPDDYRLFLLAVNGGQPDIGNTLSDSCLVNTLFSLNDPEGASNLEMRWQHARRLPDFPSPDLLFIGSAEGSSILLSIAGEHRGEVWLQLHDERPSGSNPRVDPFRRRDMQKIADSFAAFMASLGPLDVE